MPTNHLRKTINVTEREWSRIAKDQRANESDSNFLRRKLGLEAMQQGGARQVKPKRRSANPSNP